MKKVLITLGVVIALAVVGTGIWINFGPPEQVTRTLLRLARDGAGLEAKITAIPGYQIAYLEGGRGEPLVLLHGFGGNKDNWTYVAEYLTPHFRVIAPDLPGFGDSSKPSDGRYRTRDQVDHVHAFVLALGIRSFSLGGNSMGGRIAAEYAAAHPREVQSLWLLAPGGVVSAEPSEMMRRLERGEDIPLLARTPAELDQLLGFAMTVRPYVPRPVKEYVTQRGGADYALQRKIFEGLGQEWEARPLERIVAGLKTPTRIVWGAQDRVLHVSGAEILRKVMPNAAVLILPTIGHVPMIEAPQAVAADYLVFRQVQPPIR